MWCDHSKSVWSQEDCISNFLLDFSWHLKCYIFQKTHQRDIKWFKHHLCMIWALLSNHNLKFTLCRFNTGSTWCIWSISNWFITGHQSCYIISGFSDAIDFQSVFSQFCGKLISICCFFLSFPSQWSHPYSLTRMATLPSNVAGYHCCKRNMHQIWWSTIATKFNIIYTLKSVIVLYLDQVFIFFPCVKTQWASKLVLVVRVQNLNVGTVKNCWNKHKNNVICIFIVCFCDGYDLVEHCVGK